MTGVSIIIPAWNEAGVLKNTLKALLSVDYDKGQCEVIGDVPDLPVSSLRESVKKLENYESVLGPSPDGGYYLIGLNDQVVTWKLFKGINWSTETVYRETLEVIEKEAISLHILDAWEDVDQDTDLIRLANSKNTNFHKTHTWRYLKATDTA